MAVKKVIDEYQGFQGELIFCSSLRDHKISMEYSNNCSLLHLLSENSKMPEIYQNHCRFMGYDIGICEDEETSVYSSIFNEVLFGKIEELVSYKDFLNANYIFQDRSLAEEYVELHNQLSEQGKDVEDYFPMTIYEVWKQNH